MASTTNNACAIHGNNESQKQDSSCWTRYVRLVMLDSFTLLSLRLLSRTRKNVGLHHAPSLMCSSLSVSPNFLRTLLTCMSMLRSNSENYGSSTASGQTYARHHAPSFAQKHFEQINSTQSGCPAFLQAAPSASRIQFHVATLTTSSAAADPLPSARVLRQAPARMRATSSSGLIVSKIIISPNLPSPRSDPRPRPAPSATNGNREVARILRGTLECRDAERHEHRAQILACHRLSSTRLAVMHAFQQ